MFENVPISKDETHSALSRVRPDRERGGGGRGERKKEGTKMKKGYRKRKATFTNNYRRNV